jgi:hypothetical protein
MWTTDRMAIIMVDSRSDPARETHILMVVMSVVHLAEAVMIAKIARTVMIVKPR